MLNKKMKIKFWFCVCTLLYSSFAIGQNDSTEIKPYKYIALNAGASIPIIPFVQPASIPYYGLGGYCFSLSAVIPIKESCLNGIILCNYEENKFNKSSYSTDPLFMGKYSSSNYISKSLLGGIIYSDPINNKTFFIDFRILGGVLVFNNPEIQLLVQSQWYPDDYIDIKSATITAFTADL